MKIKRIFMMLLSVVMIFSMNISLSASVSAADPYSYSGVPTRPIYCTWPRISGNDVKWVQSALNMYGNYGLEVDGYFGPLCAAATKKFQADMGIEQDGAFGVVTRGKMVNWLNSRNNKTSAATGSAAASTTKKTSPYTYSSLPTRSIYYMEPRMRGNDVKWVQCALNLYGNYGLEVDGYFGPLCKTATKKFQKAVGVEQDGAFGAVTRSKMVNWLNSNGYKAPSSNTSTTSSGNGWWWPCPSALCYSKGASGFGNRSISVSSGFHRGVDIPGVTGSSVIASRSGIARTGYSNARGNYIVIDHEDGYYSVYQHLSRFNISDNVRVSQGQTIGYVGSTGNVTGPHLHFEIHKYQAGYALSVLNVDWQDRTKPVTAVNPAEYIHADNPRP